MSTIRQLSFSGGEISPFLYGRVDLVKYATGLRTLRNFFVMRHGGAASRAGLQFIGHVKDSSLTVRMIPFIFNSENAYVLEFGNLYFRVIKDRVYLTDLTLTITGITNASPAVVTYTGTDPTSGQEVAIAGVLGMTQVNGRNFKIANVNAGANTFELQSLAGVNFSTVSAGTYTAGGTAARIYTVTTPYATADLNTLEYVQSADVLTITHPTYIPQEVARVTDTSWTISDVTLYPSLNPPANLTNDAGGVNNNFWKVTAVADDTFEESVASSSTQTNGTPNVDNPITLSWDAVSGAREYNVYRRFNGIYGFIGIAGSTRTFRDVGVIPDITDTPPIVRSILASADNYPTCVTYYQQRLLLANTNNAHETVWTSRTGLFKNFTISTPLQDDDAITFTMAGRQVNAVKHMIDLGKLIIFTTGGEYSINGSASGGISPFELNIKQHSYNGSSSLRPLIVNATALYVQARGSIVRDLIYDYQSDGYKGDDLTIYSSHLVDSYSFNDWDYQKTPHSIVWIARDDGTLLGLTYNREHELIAWHHHDTDGTIENVCAIPEGSHDALYLVVKRTINGVTVRNVECMYPRQVDNIVDYVALDSALTYDGRNTDTAHTMTLSGGTAWTFTETLTLTSSASYFTALDVGNGVHLTGSDGTLIRFIITGFTNATVVTGIPHKTVTVPMRNIATATWSKAVDQVTGLWHLEGKEVSVFADGFVVANPNNEKYDPLSVTDGTLTLAKPYGVIHVGLPYLSDIETLDIDNPQGETILDKKKIVSRVSIRVEKSRGIWSGPRPPTDDDTNPLEFLTELKIRNAEEYDSPVDLATDVIDVNIEPHWNSNGRVFIRQVDPVPLTVLEIAPAGLMPFRG